MNIFVIHTLKCTYVCTIRHAYTKIRQHTPSSIDRHANVLCSLVMSISITPQVDLVLSMEQAFPILRHHKRFAITSHRVYPNERLRWHKRLWRKVYSLVWDDDLTDSIQSSLNPDEVCPVLFTVVLFTLPFSFLLCLYVSCTVCFTEVCVCLGGASLTPRWYKL